MATLFWAGDSTVQYNSILTFPQTGMGQVIHLFLKPEVAVSNHAKNGRSTKSFLAEGLFDPIRDNISEGDFLWIEFGHNDEKIEDPTRFTKPFGEYQDNLRYMIGVAKVAKAHPVLITPLERKSFTDGVLNPSQHTEYVKAMKEVGEKENVPVIDLFSMSRAKILELGEKASQELYMELPQGVYPYHMEGLHDNTHLKYNGAVVFAGMIAKSIKALGEPYAELFLDWSECEEKLNAGIPEGAEFSVMRA